jgi:SAM-dependent methyltransferase
MSRLVQDHYERLLARHYSWMFGQTFEEKVSEQRALLDDLGIGPGLSGLAIDLGSGPGWQSCALADLGARRVLAVDTSRTLLDELAARAGGRPIEPVHADMLDLARLVAPGSAEIVLCMGDTLTHLPDRTAVRALFVEAFAVLQAGGPLVLTFRDLSKALEGLDRILPIRADDDRIMTCFLDFGPERVTVTDIIHTRESGAWRMEKSSYEKLRLTPAWVVEEIASAGFDVLQNKPSGRMHAVVARKPGPA